MLQIVSTKTIFETTVVKIYSKTENKHENTARILDTNPIEFNPNKSFLIPV